VIDKYGLSKVGEGLSDEAKELVSIALKNAENKITITTVGSHWKEIAIFILIILASLFYYQGLKAKNELKTKQETFNRLEKIENIDKTLKTVEENQKILYPKIDSDLAEIARTRASLEELSKKIKILPKESFRKEVAKLPIETISEELNKLGYSNTIVTEEGTQK
jgi:hypothetical protein